jgi:hypothetical protein
MAIVGRCSRASQNSSRCRPSRTGEAFGLGFRLSADYSERTSPMRSTSSKISSSTRIPRSFMSSTTWRSFAQTASCWETKDKRNRSRTYGEQRQQMQAQQTACHSYEEQNNTLGSQPTHDTLSGVMHDVDSSIQGASRDRCPSLCGRMLRCIGKRHADSLRAAGHPQPSSATVRGNGGLILGRGPPSRGSFRQRGLRGTAPCIEFRRLRTTILASNVRRFHVDCLAASTNWSCRETLPLWRWLCWKTDRQKRCIWTRRHRSGRHPAHPRNLHQPRSGKAQGTCPR